MNFYENLTIVFKLTLYGQNNHIITEQFIRKLEYMNQTIKFLKINTNSDHLNS